MLSHTSKAIALVHDYVHRLLCELCPDAAVRNQLWDGVLSEELCEQYMRAMEHARFLLKVERGSLPATYNHYFNATLQKRRQARMADAMAELTVEINDRKYIPQDQIGKHATDMDNSQQACEDILIALQSYYKVARKRFVDTVCQQVVSYHLLEGDKSPLKILCAERVLKLSPEQLDMIAGEDAVSKNERQVLVREMDSLKMAVKVLRS